MDKKYDIPNIEQVSRYCYYAGLGLGFLGLVCGTVLYILHISIQEFMPGCTFYLTTGYYCPGCGGTRAVIALLKGDILKSLYYHPFVVYIFMYYVVYEVSYSLDLATHGKIRGARFCPVYFYIGIVFILAQWIIKNYLRFRYGFSL